MYTIKYGGIWNISKESEVFPYIWLYLLKGVLYIGESVYVSVCVCLHEQPCSSRHTWDLGS